MSKIAVVYWSGTGNTEAMANKIAEGLAKGGADATVKQVGEWTEEEVLKHEKILFGCPSMGAEVLEESEFDPFFTDLESKLSGKKVGLFGSYGWGDGEWMRNWQQRTEDAGANLFEEGLTVNEAPKGADEEACVSFGENFAKF